MAVWVTFTLFHAAGIVTELVTKLVTKSCHETCYKVYYTTCRKLYYKARYTISHKVITERRTCGTAGVIARFPKHHVPSYVANTLNFYRCDALFSVLVHFHMPKTPARLSQHMLRQYEKRAPALHTPGNQLSLCRARRVQRDACRAGPLSTKALATSPKRSSNPGTVARLSNWYKFRALAWGFPISFAYSFSLSVHLSSRFQVTFKSQ